jgi:cysteine dioxygenase
LIELLAKWDALGTTLPERTIRSGLASLCLDRRGLGESVNFDETSYQRNLIHNSEKYEVLVICWRSGQRSPIHDHGDSACGFLVVEGAATETSFEVSPSGRLVPALSRRLGAGAPAVSTSGDIHQVANPEPPAMDLIGLHVYSPRLTTNHLYRLDDTSLADHDRLILVLPKTITALV